MFPPLRLVGVRFCRVDFGGGLYFGHELGDIHRCGQWMEGIDFGVVEVVYVKKTNVG
jgi:hypothetical protein